MFRKILFIFCLLPIFLIAQQSTEKKCKTKNGGINQLPCKIKYTYGTDLIPDEDAAVKYTDILISKGELLNPEKAKPYQVSLIADNKVWHVIVKSYNCRYCKIYININKNTGEILNFYRSED